MAEPVRILLWTSVYICYMKRVTGDQYHIQKQESHCGDAGIQRGADAEDDL
jgi:hypothetical protein